MTNTTIKSGPYCGGTVTVIIQNMHWSPRLPKEQELKWTPPRIVQTSGILGGKPRITGHRISVEDVAIWHHRMGMNVDDIARKYNLSPEDVRAALQYYSDHRDAIEESIRAGEALVAEMRQRYPSTLKVPRDG